MVEEETLEGDPKVEEKKSYERKSESHLIP